MKARVVLTTEQAEDLGPLLASLSLLPPGARLLGEIRREPFDGTNADTSGRWVLTCGVVSNEQCQRMRDAYAKATSKPRRHRHE